MKKIDALVVIAIIVFWIIVFPLILKQIYGTPSISADVGEVGRGALLAIIGSIAFYFILMNYFSPKKK